MVLSPVLSSFFFFLYLFFPSPPLFCDSLFFLSSLLFSFPHLFFFPFLISSFFVLLSFSFSFFILFSCFHSTQQSYHRIRHLYHELSIIHPTILFIRDMFFIHCFCLLNHGVYQADFCYSISCWLRFLYNS